MTLREERDMQLSETYCRIVLGMDNLYRNGNGSTNEASFDREGLVPINLTDVTPHSYASWTEVREDLRGLLADYAKITDEVRRNYMQQQIGSLETLASWCSGVDIPFREKVRGFLYVNENPVTNAEQKTLHERLDRALSQRGYQGTLAQKVVAWEADRRVPAKELDSVLREMLATARVLVAERMFPQMEEVEVTPEIVYGVPYNAYCDYVNGKMYLNGDLAYTYEGLKHLVTHECFPGHTTHMYIRELGVKAGELPLDAGLVITNTASSSVFEGIADNGMRFISWGYTVDDHIYEIYQQIRSISGMNAAHMIHAEGKTPEEAGHYLKEFAFGEDNWIASRLRFVTHSLRAPFIYSYWRGNEAVYEAYSRLAPSEHNQFYQFLYKSMLSADTVKQYG
ncbi:hypothetical protein J31TS6_37180 [Brevibacillus reuszeri]|uniref:hypothetical protein n=1 Tax=Brevibacillus reuszeri TaxID=54915 RepID=UPI001B1F2258|nr:hypothetical protein [Brevibacillus reuszeri]GIO07690.1 hypothetical protein J31TS6_37180 [Brevibacillus reuszeri]